MIGIAYLFIISILLMLTATHLFAAVISYHCNHFKKEMDDSIRVDVLGIFCIILMLSGLIVYLSNYEGIL